MSWFQSLLSKCNLYRYASERRTLEALAWTSVACFIVEVLGRAAIPFLGFLFSVCCRLLYFFACYVSTLGCVYPPPPSPPLNSPPPTHQHTITCVRRAGYYSAACNVVQCVSL
jgi:hypothetical protein